MKNLFKNLLGIIFIALFPFVSFSQIEITLKKDFISQYKDKVTIDCQYKVVKAHARPNSGSKDGDLHIAGTSPEIGLPAVAEIMNAKDEDDAVDAIHEAEDAGNPIPVTGVWRIWCEHAGEQTQEQGGTFPPITNTNPDHVFEIHPVTKVQGINTIKSLKPINGYHYKDADDALFKYSAARCKLKKDGNKIKIETSGVGYNYAEFWIKILVDTQQVVPDGRFVFCQVLNSNGDLLVNKMRMVFPKNSEAEKTIRHLNKGDQMHVIGVPRINLTLVDYRITNASDRPEMLDWNLPVEMIVVAEME